MPNADKILLSLIHARVIQRLAVAGVLAGVVTACSSDTTRFGENPFANPFNETQTNNQFAASNSSYPSSMSVQSAPLAPPQQIAALPSSTPVAMAPEAANAWPSQGGAAVAAPTAIASASAPQVAPLPVAVPRSAQQANKATGSLNEQAARTNQAAVTPQNVQTSVSKQVAASLPKTVAPAVTKSEEPVTTVASGEDKAGFRWPARGRVISGFGNGNEGINIAVPEGTPVKAAESGVVAYAGNELKGYGNLVLVRHENGWVSAYANNGELKVKRGDTVARGQTIAKSGQTGNVTSPQLHFELRKGSKPVDPLPHLAGL